MDAKNPEEDLVLTMDAVEESKGGKITTVQTAGNVQAIIGASFEADVG